MAHRASAHASVASEQADKPGISIPRLVVIASFVAALASTGHGVWSARLPAQASAQIATATAGPVVAEPTPLPTDPPAAAAVEMPPADVAEPTPPRNQRRLC